MIGPSMDISYQSGNEVKRTISECQLVLLARSPPRYSLNLLYSESLYTNHSISSNIMVQQRYPLTDVELRIALYISRRWVPLDRTEAPKKTRSHPDQFLPHNAFLPSNLNLPVRTKILEVLVPEDQK